MGRDTDGPALAYFSVSQSVRRAGYVPGVAREQISIRIAPAALEKVAEIQAKTGADRSEVLRALILVALSTPDNLNRAVERLTRAEQV
jgi:hypothetical protein